MNQHDKPDQSFDTLANKFESNIYGSTKGRLRHELLLHYLQTRVPLDEKRYSVLDVGGGTGVMSRALVDLGHTVTLSDISSEVLAIARPKFAENEAIQFVLGDIMSLANEQQYDLLVCHAVLEWLQAPLTVIDKLLALVKPGGYLSLSFFNKDAQRFGNLLYGNFDYVAGGMRVKNQVRLSPNNALEPQIVLNKLSTLPAEIIHQAGIRCIHDYLKQPDMQQSHYQQLKQMEITYSSQHPYLWLGKYFHIILRKPHLIP
ncbi:MAG: S-adenosylmethionine-dependent methyltransferase [Paraglaciecola sp.]|jgi:S-adenosylmethionine-dependent methyltransferase